MVRIEPISGIRDPAETDLGDGRAVFAMQRIETRVNVAPGREIEHVAKIPQRRPGDAVEDAAPGDPDQSGLAIIGQGVEREESAPKAQCRNVAKIAPFTRFGASKSVVTVIKTGTGPARRSAMPKWTPSRPVQARVRGMPG